ncbi:sensor histidine kinase [Pseudoalteromonas luteoviolacea]|uniref:histidine kinase n=1 Tax=Pseudoalteromonas luteoviolacea S4054 TaxID=1129367 RepID=A0A0F6AC26_9GAMM|nr:histidine kinase [Pseudoalteromonas luteoviolacea]AOT06871.1 histidine kinase [Pseudoalteromonas luteoviolacea]AOT11789.1 histidine kinase [Pseudoalteromonas luteoviolacea]AOT16701.1 histidine kinase [Pseudoalteromonas luteoviolacea]KKE83366.1 hypothetical protein N479_14585 [Pseudoalteromonas luteoviolacea S4054]KZN74017.1 hypothetical protein N481_09900 [Pseudoalteromonas luteoviolacea S4047-1]
MDIQIRHTTDWRFSTIASWLGVTCACAYFANSPIALMLQLPVSLSILLLLLYVLKHPNKHVFAVALGYLILILGLIPLTSTSLLFIHLVMFAAVFSPHFSFAKVMAAITLAMTVYGIEHFDRWQGDIPWVTFVVWLFFCSMNWFVSRRIIESLNMHYQSRQNYKELKAAQHMMGAMSAFQTRQHISRELHDSLGHKLTALSIHLDFVKRTAPESVAATVNTCHQLSQQALSEVRDIVSTQRSDKPLLKEALEGIFTLTPTLACSLDVEVKDASISQQHALCIVRFCQEMVSNTLKHTQAQQFHFKVQIVHQSDRQYVLAKAWHNQPESCIPKMGNGLSGLKERTEQLHGDFQQLLEGHRLVSMISLPLEQGDSH